MNIPIVPLIFSLIIVVICGPPTISIQGTIRDFANNDSITYEDKRHPDFNNILQYSKGLVQKQIGSDRTPVLNHTSNWNCCITNETTFNQWFHDVPGVNIVLNYTLVLTNNGSDYYEFKNYNFFPIDHQGYGDDIDQGHNYGFCFEFHTMFTYSKSNTELYIEGDDDVWIFINGSLVVDLGGIHAKQNCYVNIFSLGLIEGKTYPIDGFFCERHYKYSDFIFMTNIELHSCEGADTDGDSIFGDCDMCPNGFSIYGNDLKFDIENLTVSMTSEYIDKIDYGDGHNDNGNAGYFSHTYMKPGTYNVSFMYITDLGCNSSIVTSKVNVSLPSPPQSPPISLPSPPLPSPSLPSPPPSPPLLPQSPCVKKEKKTKTKKTKIKGVI